MDGCFYEDLWTADLRSVWGRFSSNFILMTETCCPWKQSEHPQKANKKTTVMVWICVSHRLMGRILGSLLGMLFGGWSGNIKWWDLARGRPRLWSLHPILVLCLCFLSMERWASLSACCFGVGGTRTNWATQPHTSQAGEISAPLSYYWGVFITTVQKELTQLSTPAANQQQRPQTFPKPL